MKFYKCNTCDQIHIRLLDNENQTLCCGSPTEELMEENSEEITENHMPIIRKIGNFVSVSLDESHPMIDVHHIAFICMETNQGFQYKNLLNKTSAKADFILAKEEEIVNVYVYCNVHQLWSLHL